MVRSPRTIVETSLNTDEYGRVERAAHRLGVSVYSLVKIAVLRFVEAVEKGQVRPGEEPKK